VSDSGQWFDHPIADLTPDQRATLETLLRNEGIPATFGPTLVRTDIAFEARVTTLIDQARASARPTAEPPPPGSAPTMAPPATGYQPTYQPGVAPYGVPAGVPAGAPNNSNAVLALVLGIGSLVLGLSCGIGFFAGPFAVVIGQRARREISRTGEQGDGMALAGVITGAISSVLLALGLIALIVIIIVAVAAGN
jgi:hypothetical protein